MSIELSEGVARASAKELLDCDFSHEQLQAINRATVAALTAYESEVVKENTRLREELERVKGEWREEHDLRIRLEVRLEAMTNERDVWRRAFDDDTEIANGTTPPEGA